MLLPQQRVNETLKVMRSSQQGSQLQCPSFLSIEQSAGTEQLAPVNFQVSVMKTIPGRDVNHERHRRSTEEESKNQIFSSNLAELSQISPIHSFQRDLGSFLESRQYPRKSEITRDHHQSQQVVQKLSDRRISPFTASMTKKEDQNKSADVIILSRAESRRVSRSPSTGFLERAMSRQSVFRPLTRDSMRTTSNNNTKQNEELTRAMESESAPRSSLIFDREKSNSEQLLSFFKTFFSSLGMQKKLQEFEKGLPESGVLDSSKESGNTQHKFMETSSFKKAGGVGGEEEDQKLRTKLIPPLNISDISQPLQPPITASLSNISIQDIKDEMDATSEQGEYCELLHQNLEKISEIPEESNAEFQLSAHAKRNKAAAISSGHATGRESELNTVKKIMPAPHKHKKSSLDELLQPLHGEGFYQPINGGGILISSARQTNSMSSADFHEISPRLGAPSPKYGAGAYMLFHQNGRSSGTEGSSLRNIQPLNQIHPPEVSDKQNTSKSSTCLDHNKAPLSMQEVRKMKKKRQFSRLLSPKREKLQEDSDQFYPKCGNTILTDQDIEMFDEYVNQTISTIDKGEQDLLCDQLMLTQSIEETPLQMEDNHRFRNIYSRHETPASKKLQDIGIQAHQEEEDDEDPEEEEDTSVKNEDITKATTTVFEERTPVNLTSPLDGPNIFKSSRASLSHNEGLLTQQIPKVTLTSGGYPAITPKREVPRLALGLPPCVPKNRGKQGTRILKTGQKQKRQVLLWREKENASLQASKELMMLKKTFKAHKEQEADIKRSENELNRTIRAVLHNKRTMNNFLTRNTSQNTPQLSARIENLPLSRINSKPGLISRSTTPLGTKSTPRVDLGKIKEALVGRLLESNSRKLQRQKHKLLQNLGLSVTKEDLKETRHMTPASQRPTEFLYPSQRSLTSRILRGSSDQILSPLKRWGQGAIEEKQLESGATLKKKKSVQRRTLKRKQSSQNPLMRGLSIAKNGSKSKIFEKQRGSVYALTSTVSFDVKPPNISWTGVNYTNEPRKPKKKAKKGRNTAAVTPRREQVFVRPPPPSEKTCCPTLSTHREPFQDTQIQTLVMLEAADLLSEEFERKCGFASDDPKVLLNFWRDIRNKKEEKKPNKKDPLQKRQYLLSLFKEEEMAEAVKLKLSSQEGRLLSQF